MKEIVGKITSHILEEINKLKPHTKGITDNYNKQSTSERTALHILKSQIENNFQEIEDYLIKVPNKFANLNLMKDFQCSAIIREFIADILEDLKYSIIH